jgi:hypothetical protein
VTPRQMEQELSRREQEALDALDAQARRFFDEDQRLWMAEDWVWVEARSDRIHDAYHPDDKPRAGEGRAEA